LSTSTSHSKFSLVLIEVAGLSAFYAIAIYACARIRKPLPYHRNKHIQTILNVLKVYFRVFPIAMAVASVVAICTAMVADLIALWPPAGFMMLGIGIFGVFMIYGAILESFIAELRQRSGAEVIAM
jgi:hypothetical protein